MRGKLLVRVSQYVGVLQLWKKPTTLDRLIP